MSRARQCGPSSTGEPRLGLPFGVWPRHWRRARTVTLVAVVLLLGERTVVAQAIAEPAEAVAAPSLPADEGAGSQDKPQRAGTKRRRSAVRFVMKDRPSLRIGDVLRVDFRVKLQGEFQARSPELSDGPFAFRRKRVGIEGSFLDYVEYELEGELGRSNPWRDVFVNLRVNPAVQIRAGKFKIPFSRDQLTSPVRHDFINRARLGDDLAPARDVGIAAHGRLKTAGIRYDLGLFRQDGENARFGRTPGAGRTVAGRMTMLPVPSRVAGAARDLEVGFGITTSTVAEGRSALRGRTVADETFFSQVYVDGLRLRLGIDARWSAGPFSLSSEFVRVRDERRHQGLLLEDLPPLISRGSYISGTWLLTGDRKGDGVEPRRPLFQGGGGAAELAARYERIRFGSFSDLEAPSRSPRAANVLAASDNVWTVGLNWYPNRWTKIQINAMRERLANPDPTSSLSRAIYWTRVCRLQFVL